MSTPKTTTDEAQKFLDKDMLQYLLDQLSGKIIAGCGCGSGSTDLTNYPTKTELTSTINEVLNVAKLSNDDTSITLTRPKAVSSLDPITIDTEKDIVQFKTINNETIVGEGNIEISSSSSDSGSGSGSGSGTVNLENYVKFTDEATTEKNGVLTATDKAYIEVLKNAIIETHNAQKDYKVPLDYLTKFFGEFLNNNVALTSDPSALGEKAKEGYENAESFQFWDFDGGTVLFGGAEILMNYASSEHAGLMTGDDKASLDISTFQTMVPYCSSYINMKNESYLPRVLTMDDHSTEYLAHARVTQYNAITGTGLLELYFKDTSESGNYYVSIGSNTYRFQENYNNPEMDDPIGETYINLPIRCSIEDGRFIFEELEDKYQISWA